MKILVTGGAGFVGSNLALALKKTFKASRVIALDNLKRRGSELNLPRIRTGKVEFIHGDVRQPADLSFSDLDWIIECSAEPSALSGRAGDTDYLVHTNLLGTFNCLEIARKHNVKMIFISTSRVYPIAPMQKLPIEEHETRFVLGEVKHLQGISNEGIAEDFTLEGARTLYGFTKLSSELLITEYIDSFNLDIVINRCGLLTGPWQMGKVDQGVVVLWLASHFFGGKLSYIGYGGSGKQVRDILHVDDLADLVIQQIKNIRQHRGKTYNVGGGNDNTISLLELTKICQDLTGKKIPISVDLEDRPGDIPWFVTDSSKIKDKTGWSPKRSTEETLQEIFDWLEGHKRPLRTIFV